MDRLQIAGVAEAKGHLCLGAEVGKPGPSQDAVDRDDQILPIGGHGLETRRRTGVHLVMEHALTFVVEETHGHAARMPINAAIRVMLCGVESPEVSSS